MEQLFIQQLENWTIADREVRNSIEQNEYADSPLLGLRYDQKGHAYRDPFKGSQARPEPMTHREIRTDVFDFMR